TGVASGNQSHFVEQFVGPTVHRRFVARARGNLGFDAGARLMLFGERRLGLSLLAAVFFLKRHQLARGLWFGGFLMCNRLARHASPLPRYLSIHQTLSFWPYFRKMRNSLDRMEHFAEVS